MEQEKEREFLAKKEKMKGNKGREKEERLKRP